MLIISLFTILFSAFAAAQWHDTPDAPGYDRWSENCLHKLKGLRDQKGVRGQPGFNTFGGTCKGTWVIKEKLMYRLPRKEWVLYSCCRKKNGEYGDPAILPLQNCLAFNDAGGGTLTWQKVMRLAEACQDCKVVGESQNGAPGAHLRCSCEAPRQAAKTYEMPIHANLWAEGDLEGKRLSRYPCGIGSGVLECGLARCVRNPYEYHDPPGHWHGPQSPDANDPKR
ncbi:hypothetical protein LX36DRAFT_729288 [Colletotrichum falcatum]|nr:hypothetical protein LX36DRAFT_729288 [Colletotrichum falcatum]